MTKQQTDRPMPDSPQGRGQPGPVHSSSMPAEWERHDATWIAWPHNRDDWPGKLGAIHWVYGEIVRHLAEGEMVRTLVHSPLVEARARSVLEQVGVDAQRVKWVPCRTNRGWTRDTGPIFVRTEGGLAVARFRFNGWARYADWQHDDVIAETAAQACGLPLLEVRQAGREIVLEGGAIDANGAGTLLATEECLLDATTQVRNPGLGRADYEELFRRQFGVNHVIWLGRGIVGDDTHGHVDDLCRFVGAEAVVLCQESDPRDANYQALEENRERLEGARLADGSRLQVVPLPMPRPLYFEGARLPASYANFYLANAAVLVPTFNDPQDRIALGVLSELFSDRPVVGIHAVDLVLGLGAVHCLTQQQPEDLASGGSFVTTNR